jgi:hypothetical protein
MVIFSQSNMLNLNFKKQIHFNAHMGRMGNQMFQYACAKAIQEEQGFYCSLSHLDKIKYFQLDKREIIVNKVKAFLFFRLWKKIWGNDTLNTNLDCLQQLYQDQLISIVKPTTVWGFFQSPVYFDAIKDKIKKYFTVKEVYKKEYNSFLKKNGLEAGRYIALHIRRTDYKGFVVPGLQGDDFTLPSSYFHQALAKINNHQNWPVVFVSDDPNAMDELFPEIEQKIISRNNEITDFLILQNAGKIIISNSTYSWWAAYLNDHSGADVYCPKYFLGFKEQKEIPVKIYPAHWNQLAVM